MEVAPIHPPLGAIHLFSEVSCVPNTPNTLVRCIGTLVQQRDSEMQVIWMIISGSCNLKLKMAANKHLAELVVNGVSMLRNKA